MCSILLSLYTISTGTDLIANQITAGWISKSGFTIFTWNLILIWKFNWVQIIFDRYTVLNIILYKVIELCTIVNFG